jgi:hypothetical protein
MPSLAFLIAFEATSCKYQSLSFLLIHNITHAKVKQFLEPLELARVQSEILQTFTLCVVETFFSVHLPEGSFLLC